MAKQTMYNMCNILIGGLKDAIGSASGYYNSELGEDYRFDRNIREAFLKSFKFEGEKAAEMELENLSDVWYLLNSLCILFMEEEEKASIHNQ